MNKREWYGKTRYGDSEEKMKMVGNGISNTLIAFDRQD